MLRLLTAALITTGLMAGSAAAQTAEVKRGQYLVTIMGCFDCHTPGYFLGKPDMTRYLGGSDVGFEVPGLGTFVGPNLTPDPETGLGKWTKQQIVTAITTGVTPEGRKLWPGMPWPAFSKLTKSDANAIAAFLKTLKPVKNKVPGPFGPDEKRTVFFHRIMPPEVQMQK